MTVRELLERLKNVPESAEVELVIWNRMRECDPGLSCSQPFVQECSDNLVCIQGPGEPEEIGEEEDDEEEEEETDSDE